MRKGAQIVFYASSFATVLFLGNLFEFFFVQAGYHAGHLLGNKPLPPIFAFFVAHHHLPGPLALLPWLGLVGAPLLTLADAQNFWDAQAFVVRFLAFLSVELLLFILLLLALILPFVPIYGVLASDRPQSSMIELVVRLIFWCSAWLIGLTAIRRSRQIRNERSTPKS